jgi:hypothetical protein
MGQARGNRSLGKADFELPAGETFLVDRELKAAIP